MLLKYLDKLEALLDDRLGGGTSSVHIHQFNYHACQYCISAAVATKNKNARHPKRLQPAKVHHILLDIYLDKLEAFEAFGRRYFLSSC